MTLPFVFSAFMATKWHRALGAGAAAVGLLWLASAAYLNSLNEGILATRIAPIFSLPGPWALIAVTALIGAVSGGLAALSGYLLRSLFLKPTRR
jgi:nucleoside recognition membrane protein YjiH